MLSCSESPFVCSIERYFSDLKDPRVERTRIHPLLEILTVTLLGTICGAEGWTDLEVFAESRLHWLQTFLTLKHGAPSDDTFRRVLGALEPQAFERCFGKWAEHLVGHTEGKLVALDGKTLRHSFDRASEKTPLHLVQAWVEENNLVLGQVAVADKSNEIEAFPALLDLLELRGAIVTIDAMGCQKTIAAQIVDKGADYVLSLKDNHPTAHAQVRAHFDQLIEIAPLSCVQSVDGDHGRLEVRRVWVSDDLTHFEARDSWRALRSVVRVERQRTLGGKTTVEQVHFVSSLPSTNPLLIAQAIRGHWAIENGLHWTLDVSFREDMSRIRLHHAPHNFALIRRWALSLLRNERSVRGGVPAKRLRAALDSSYLLKVLAGAICSKAITI